MDFSAQQIERLDQWRNVYGGGDKCVTAAHSDPRIRELLDFEFAIGPLPDDALAIRERIVGVEGCHERLVRNIEDLIRMIGAMQPSHIAYCGSVNPELVEAVRPTLAAAAAWAEGRTEEAGEWAEVLGEPTPEKRWLVACLCKTVATQLAGGEAEPLPEPGPEAISPAPADIVWH